MSSNLQVLLRKPFVILSLLTFLISLRIYLLYFSNLTFGDEYDNFTYAWLLKNGLLPYRDFFTHHFPSLIFMGAPLEFLGHSKIIYRIFILIMNFSLFTFFYLYFSGIWRYTILLFMLIASFGISLYGGFQYADGTFWALFLLAGFFIILKKQGEKLRKREAAIFALLIFLVIMSSPVHLLGFIIILLYHLFLKFKKEIKNRITNALVDLKNIGLFLFFYLIIFTFYLFVTFSFKDFYFATIFFNNEIFYHHVYKQWISPKFLDFYLHTSYDVVNHFSELVEKQGPALVTFLKASKYIIPISSYPNGYFNYLLVIFNDFYNNFFTFEMFIALFTIAGILTFLLTKRPALAIFSIIFLFSLRLRLNELIHMAPYYLFASWLLACAFTLNIYNIIVGKRRLISTGFIVVLGCVVSLFIAKNWYDFSQIAFNRFPQKNAQTVEFIGQHAGYDDRLLVLSGESASYYYDADLFQYGYFVNYFEWYDRSPRLKRIWLKNIADYHGRFLIVPRAEWTTYCQNPTSYPGWLKMTFELIQKNYFYSGYENQDDIVFSKAPVEQEGRGCQI